MTSRASPTIGTSAGRFLPISAGSMSAWTIFASGAKVERSPVTRSSNRAPRAISRSDFCIAATGRRCRAYPASPGSGGGHRERATGHEGGDHGRAGLVGEVEELGGGLGLDHTAADVEHRATRLADQAGGLPDLLGVRPGGRPVAGQSGLDRPAEGGLGLQDVLGQVDQDRAGTPGGGDVERLGDRPRDVRRVGDQHVVLGDRQRDAADVGFLERVGADELAAHLPRDRDDRHRVEHRVRERRHEVRRPRARSRDADADAAGGLRVSGGGVARPCSWRTRMWRTSVES